ncbi:hypothetical protein BVRB_6g139930 [Beta vulgaris subsp. vulgaris]|nr:hypothetical protein BVRB_6g139930 [Beta vulgaris subsp. vulgaris]
MKLENEHVLGVQTPPRKSYNPFDSDDEDSNTYAKSNINGYDIKSFESTPDSLTFHLDSGNLSWEEAILNHSRILSNSISADATSEEALYRKDTELFTDKSVTECELPEVMFSYKDNGFHSVKDIGIDEGVPTNDKVWIKSQDNHESKTVSFVLPLNDNVNGDVALKEGMKIRSDNDVEEDPSVQDQAEDSLKESGLVHGALERPYSADQCGTDDLLEVNEFEHDSSEKEKEFDSSWQSKDLVESGAVVYGRKDPQVGVGEKDEVNCHKEENAEIEVSEEEHCKDNVPPEHADADLSLTKPSIVHGVETSMESNERQNEEATSEQSAELPALHEPVSNGINNTLSYNSKVESGSIILDFNAAATDPEKEKEDEVSQKNEAVEKPPVTQTMSRDDSGAPGSILDLGTDKRVHGETSFSAAMPLPASITYMGPVAHSGNISLRSESSAGSTRSFAFPVLQAEWNTSPVRMAKADQRNFRKQRGWVHTLVCCKF